MLMRLVNLPEYATILLPPTEEVNSKFPSKYWPLRLYARPRRHFNPSLFDRTRTLPLISFSIWVTPLAA
jgi:hypothetical protein